MTNTKMVERYIKRRVYASPTQILPTLHFSASLAAWPSKKMVREGVLGRLDTLMISFRRGTPRVTFLADTPA